jgi:hypothetical protein
MSEVRDEYIRALFDLSKADPARWATFVEAFKAYTMSELEKGLTVQIELAGVFVGSSRKMKELRDDFIGIEGLAEKLRKPRHGTI